MIEDYFDRCFKSERLKQKKVYIFGVSILAIAVIKYLRTHGMFVSGFSDFSFQSTEENLEFSDTRIFMPKTMKGLLNRDCIAVVACTRHSEAEKYRKWIKNCSEETEIIIVDNQSEVYIDVSGRCNLRCRSCQVYNHDPKSFLYTGRTEMSKALFCDVLDKIQKEIPNNPAIFLFIFGEPLLVKNLSLFIDEIHKRGMLAIISTNLSLICDLESILQAEPEILKISVSGFSQEIYETTHNGGNVELVKSNMYRIREIIDKYGLKTNVMVGYHIYNNNADECRNMSDLCKELRFLFQPRRASYCNIPKQSGIDEYSEQDKMFIKKYYTNWQDILNIEPMDIPQKGECNTAKNKLFIDYNGNVMLCYLVMHKAGVYKSYLDVSLDDIRKWQSENQICDYCKRVGLASID